MCGYSPTDNVYEPYVPPAKEVVDHTRVFESQMEGALVPESAWQAFFGEGCAPIPAWQFLRMFAARKAAVTYLAVQEGTRMRPRRQTAFRCVAD